MEAVELKARAKINLSLDVCGKRADGYHEVRMLMQTVTLHDRVLLETCGGDIEISCSSRWVPCDSSNTAYKAARLLKDKFGIDSGIRITIEKNIPVAAGLAGGSTDAAAVLKGMDRLFGLNMGREQLRQAGKLIGADVPYCLTGGTMLAEGIGEALTPLPKLQGVNIVLAKPRLSVSTAWVYKNFLAEEVKAAPDTGLLINAIREGNIYVLAKNMRNVLETVTEKKHPIIGGIKRRMLEYGALGSMMSGSGPTVFGIFNDRASAEKAYDKLADGRWECFLTETICEEIE